MGKKNKEGVVSCRNFVAILMVIAGPMMMYCCCSNYLTAIGMASWSVNEYHAFAQWLLPRSINFNYYKDKTGDDATTWTMTRVDICEESNQAVKQMNSLTGFGQEVLGTMASSPAANNKMEDETGGMLDMKSMVFLNNLTLNQGLTNALTLCKNIRYMAKIT